MSTIKNPSVPHYPPCTIPWFVLDDMKNARATIDPRHSLPPVPVPPSISVAEDYSVAERAAIVSALCVRVCNYTRIMCTLSRFHPSLHEDHHMPSCAAPLDRRQVRAHQQSAFLWPRAAWRFRAVARILSCRCGRRVVANTIGAAWGPDRQLASNLFLVEQLELGYSRRPV